MTFSSFETSIDSGRPVEIYHFTLGSTHWYYTSAPDSFLFGGNTYVPRQISRSDPSQSSEDRMQELQVTLPAEDDISSRFTGIVPAISMTLEISRYHRTDTNAFIVWAGAIIGAAYTKQGAECILRCATAEAAFSRIIPRYKYHAMCNNVLFDSRCQVVQATYTHTATVTGVTTDETAITVNGLSAAFPAADWAVGGYVNYNSEDYRFVTAQSGDVLTLFMPFLNNPLNQTVSVYAGCDHLQATCASKFSNGINFGGFPYVPTKNPFISGVK